MKFKSFLLFILVILLNWLLSSCDIKKPQMPSWDTSIQLPLSQYEFTALDLVEDSTIFDIRETDSLIFIDINGDIDRQSIDSTDLAIGGVDTTSHMVIDTISIDSLDILRVPDSSLCLGKLSPELYNLVGQSVQIPAGTPSISSIELASTDFDYVHILSGKIKVQLRNNLPVPILSGSIIQFFSHPLSVGDDSLLTTMIIPQDLLPGEVGEYVDDIQYPWLISPIIVNFDLQTGASDGEVEITTDLLENSGLGVSLTFLDISSDQASSRLSAQEYYWDEKIAILEDSNKVYHAKIMDGKVYIHIDNQTALSGKVIIKIWNLENPNGDPFLEDIDIFEEEILDLEYPLENYNLLPINDLGFPDINLDVPIDSIHYEVIFSHEKFEEPITIQTPDSVIVGIRMDSLYFKSFKGEIQYTEFDIDPIETTDILDYETFDGEILFSNLRLLVNLNNEFELGTIHFDLNLKGYREEDGVIVDSVVITPLITDSITPGQNDFEIGNPETNPAIADSISKLVNILPTKMVVSGSAHINGLVQVDLGKGISGSYSFNTPFEIKLEHPLKLESEERELTKEELSQDIQDAINENRVQNLEFNSNIINSLPLGGTFLICFDSVTSTNNLFDTSSVPLYLEIDNFEVGVLGNGGRILEPSESQKSIILNSEQIQLFASPPVRWGYIVSIDSTVNGPNDGYIKLQASNSAAINGLLKFKLRIDEDLFNE